MLELFAYCVSIKKQSVVFRTFFYDQMADKKECHNVKEDIMDKLIWLVLLMQVIAILFMFSVNGSMS
jgi:hypothetical protein